MYFHQPMVCFFFSNNASVIELTKALRSFVCLCLFFQLSDWASDIAQCWYNVRTMFLQCSYNVRTMFVQWQKKFVQCSYNAPLKFVQYCTNASAIVQTLCELCVRSILQINVRWYIKKCQQTSPSILQWFCYFSGCTLDNEIVPFVLTLLWPAARARLSMRDLTCMLYTVPRTQSYRCKAMTTPLFWYNFKGETRHNIL